MSELICNQCNQLCNVHESKVPVEFTPGVPSQGAYTRYAVSACCKVGYRVESIAEEMRRETMRENVAQRGSRI